MQRPTNISLLALLIASIFIPDQCHCFSTSLTHRFHSQSGSPAPQNVDNSRYHVSSLYMSDPKQGNDEMQNNFLTRFTDPKIDDPGLPLTDTLIAQVVAPTLQVLWLSLVHAPAPTWLRPIFDNALWQYRGSLVAPTLIHGAALASCWVGGSLAAEAFERESYDLAEGGYPTVLWRLFKAGSFSTGLLILATQVDLLLEFGRYVQPGESAETDLRLLTALVEVLNDVVFEAIAIGSWRIYRASLTRK